MIGSARLFLLIGLFVIFIITSLVFICLWTYHDAKKRGLNAGLWTVVVILVPNLLGLVLYLLIGRREEKTICTACGRSTLKSAKFCSNCGTEIIIQSEITEQKNSEKKYLRLFFVSLIGVFLIFVLITASLIRSSVFENPGISIGVVENNIGKRWYVSYKFSTDNINNNFTRNIRIKEGTPETLYVYAESIGDLYLEVTQDDLTETLDLSDASGNYEMDLTKFSDGKIYMKLIGEDAKNVKFNAHWE